jgi:hypothetical protein
MPAWPRTCVTGAAPCRLSMSRRQRSLRVRSSTKSRGIVSGPDFVPLSGSDHAVSIARSVNASSSHGSPAGCRTQRPQRRPGWPPDRCSNGQAVHVSGAHRPLPPGGSRASCRSQDTSRTVRAPLPPPLNRLPQRPSSAVIVCSACPARLSVSRTAPSRHRAWSARRPQDLRAGVPGRHVPCAVPPGHPTPPAARLASSTDDSSLDFSSLETFTRPKPQTRH